eukprot:scaffold588619_cov37-Prasinocladus_malaysianus.AAC.1
MARGERHSGLVEPCSRSESLTTSGSPDCAWHSTSTSKVGFFARTVRHQSSRGTGVLVPFGSATTDVRTSVSLLRG